MHRILSFLGLLVVAGVAAADAPWASRVDEVFAEYDSTQSPGCALGVIQGGRLAYARGYGMANLEHGVPIDTTTVFRIGSTSKQFTAMAILLLEQAGQLSLEDDIRKYLPELRESSPPITIHHLLDHTSGIRDYLTLSWLAGYRDEDYYTDADVLDLLSRQLGTDFEPGSSHSYSNSGYFLLSQIVLRVADRSLREYAAESIFAPLGMEHSHFHDDHTHLVPQRAAGYAAEDEGGFSISQTALEMVGDGGVFTSIEDLVKWDHNFYAPEVGNEALLERMQTARSTTEGKSLDYALGLVVDEYRGLRRVHHGGAFVGYRAQLTRFPTERTSIAVLCNLASTNPTRLALAVADVVLEQRLATPLGTAEAPEPGAPSEQPPDLERWIGAYRHIEDGFIARVEAKGDTLAIFFPWDEEVALASLGGPLFGERDDPEGLRLEFGESGFHRLRKGDDPVVYERVELAPPGRDLEEYVGEYSSAEVGATYHVVLSDGELRLRNGDSRRQEPIDAPLEPTLEDAFQLHYLPIEFDRDAEGEISGFRLSAGRVRNLFFARR
jgi:CubicO group peptidase (beta-lactamase class C family)